MEKIAKKIICLALVLASVSFPLQIQAAKKPYMKRLNISWDLKPDKKIKYQTKYEVLGYREQTAEIKNYKITDAAKKGYKKLTFTAVIGRDPKITNGQFQEFYHKCNEMYGYVDDPGEKISRMGGNNYYAVVDYRTGKSLEYEYNDKDVKVRSGKWKYSKQKKKYEDSDGCWWEFSKYTTANVSVVYPEDYKDLCLVVGGSSSQYGRTSEDSLYFDNDIIKFGETSYVSPENKKIAHAMRIK